jgi:fibronectin-binding autotransporter adhesin
MNSSTSRAPTLAVRALAIAVACAATQALAAESTFVAGDATWSVSGNWNNGIPTASDVAVFSQTDGATVANLSANTTVAGLRVTNTSTTLIESNGVARYILSLGASGITLDAGAGNLQIGNNASTNQRVGLSLSANQTWTNNSISGTIFKDQGSMGGSTPVTNLNASTLTLAGPGNFLFRGDIVGAGGSINMAGTGLLTLVSTATYTGATTVSSGTLMLGEASGNGSVLGAITNNGTVLFNRNGSITANSMSGTGSVGIWGAATPIVTFAGTNSYTYTGGTRILSPATLVVSSTASLPGWNVAGKLQVDSGAALSVSNYSGSDLDTLLGTGAFAAGSTLAVSTTAASVTMSANTSGINLTKSGENTLTLTGANTPTTTTISAGRLQVGTGGTTGSIAGNVSNSGTLGFNRSDDITLGGSVTGSGILIKEGAGKLSLTATNNAFTGNVLVNNGALEVASIGSSAATIFLSDNNENATFRYVGTVSSTLNRQVQVGNFASGTGSGTILSDGAGALSFTNAAFSNTFGGATAARTLILGGANTGANTIAGTIADNSVLGTVGVTKTGVGTWFLGGNNTYTGATSIDAGTLVVNGALSSGAVTVAPAATLGGSGTIGGAVTVLGGAIVAPGNSPGTLTVNNAFSLANTSLLNFELDALNTTAGGGVNDLITGVTNLTLDGTLNITGSGDWTTVAANTSWRLFNYSGSLTNNDLSIGSAPALASGFSYLIDTETTGQVNLVVVPEPATWLLTLVGVGGAWVVRRVRRTAPSLR